MPSQTCLFQSSARHLVLGSQWDLGNEKARVNSSENFDLICSQYFDSLPSRLTNEERNIIPKQNRSMHLVFQQKLAADPGMHNIKKIYL
ncbi:Hypothetical predicted protein, partial [Podarcis lilfordi]